MVVCAVICHHIMVDKASVSCERVDVLRGLAVVAEWVHLDARVELDRALQQVELDVQLLGGVVADQELSDVHVHREVRREQAFAELLHVRHHLRRARRRDRCSDPRRLADRLLTFGNAGRIVADPGKACKKALAERALLAVVLVLGLELVDDVHAQDLGRRVPGRADDLLVVRLVDEDPVGAHIVLRALVSVALEDARAGWESVFVAVLSTETSVAVRRDDVAEVQGDRTPQRLRRTLITGVAPSNSDARRTCPTERAGVAGASALELDPPAAGTCQAAHRAWQHVVARSEPPQPRK